jgi:hypothetical protein
MKKSVSWPSSALLGVMFLFAHSHMARAEDIAVVICDVAAFSCPADDIVDGSLAQLIYGNVLGANRYIVQSINYADPLGDATFTGTFVTADSAGKYIYAWGTGVATGNAAVAGDYLDVSFRQNYATVPGLWSFSEMLSGSCDANAMAAPASVGFQGQVNGANLSVIGPPNDCAASPFTYSAGPFLKSVGRVTQLLGGVQYFFPVGGNYPETITLPFGDDFPDPSINFNDPNNPFNFITNTDIPQGFTQQPNVPEPSTLGYVLLAGCCLGASGRYRRPRQAA